MNPTIRKFGWPETVLCEFDHWVILARPAQLTLGSLVLASKSDASAFSELSAESCAELSVATTAIERALAAAVGYDRMNYLMLMMVDTDVHFHVLPRYDGVRSWMGHDFADADWPKPPDLGRAVPMDADRLRALAAWLKDFFD